MKFTAAIPVALTFIFASALASSDDPTVSQAAQQCGNGQVISCCNSKTSSEAQGGLGANVADGLLGGNCNAVPIDLLGVQVPISQACAGNQAACCTGSQSGLVNVQCTPINL